MVSGIVGGLFPISRGSSQCKMNERQAERKRGMSGKISFYLFAFLFLVVGMLTIFLIADNSWYKSVNPVLVALMYAGTAVISFGMREEMLNQFEK